MKKLVSFSLGVLFSLNFVLADNMVPKLNIQLSRIEIGAVIALGVALILILIYWMLQIRVQGFD